jgi:hypothetical protein
VNLLSVGGSLLKYGGSIVKYAADCICCSSSPPTGACCDGEGGCDQQTEASCVSSGGEWQGANTDCCVDVVASEDCPRVCTGSFNADCCINVTLVETGIPGAYSGLRPIAPRCPTSTPIGWANPVVYTITGTPGVNVLIAGTSYPAGVPLSVSILDDPDYGPLITTPSGTVNLRGQIPFEICVTDA